MKVIGPFVHVVHVFASMLPEFLGIFSLSGKSWSNYLLVWEQYGIRPGKTVRHDLREITILIPSPILDGTPKALRATNGTCSLCSLPNSFNEYIVNKCKKFI